MQIIVQRGTVVPFESLPAESIALDGYCRGPAIDTTLRRYSFDHHEGCIRTVTLATCQQVYAALRVGLDPRGFSVFINDVDGDTVLAVALLRHPEWVRGAVTGPAVGKRHIVEVMVNLVGALDAHGPAWYRPETRSIGWHDRVVSYFYDHVMSAVNTVQRNRSYGQANLEELLENCVARLETLFNLDTYSVQETLSSWETPKDEDGDMKVIAEIREGSEPFFVMVESASFIFPTLYRKGYKVAVAYNKLPDGSYAYTVAKLSEFINYPLGPSNVSSLLAELNALEEGWGGGSTIGGAPRNTDGSRSRLEPAEVYNIARLGLCGKDSQLRPGLVETCYI